MIEGDDARTPWRPADEGEEPPRLARPESEMGGPGGEDDGEPTIRDTPPTPELLQADSLIGACRTQDGQDRLA